ncbi:class I SAM-dependent methyltransferase [Moorena sp. SIO3H5]|uniref:class I SAM-dependent methyltransferase n=1 Tax=Moorena sp. SIO3H5 TaxID=2607834 RepID=UPI0013BBAEA9|nr:class I SAM-dependent methyltransferase [Moorena sp. SIO3H5]NEO68926.1 class I SAM-dependent methyltransferase [Moorena sp. SIO3H5]
MDVYSSSPEKIKLIDVKNFLRENLKTEVEKYFGIQDNQWLERVTNNWFDVQKDYTGRWKVIKEKSELNSKILDMAAGCGTFVLFGLNHGYDVWGVEPETWKREYFLKKINACNYSSSYADHILEGVGESLPFEDNFFDIVTTYQTLEHVQCVQTCIIEMLRVLKPGGCLYIQCPDYNSFFEPHYRIPFLPKMNKKIAKIYLKLIGKPTLGLDTLQWTTEKEIITIIDSSNYIVKIEQTGLKNPDHRRIKIINKLPKYLQHSFYVYLIDWIYKIKQEIKKISLIGRRENHVSLWITKIQ